MVLIKRKCLETSTRTSITISNLYQEVTPMNKSKILVLILTFLFLFSSSVFGEGKKEYYDNGKFWSKGPLKSETPYNGMGTGWHESGEKKYEVVYKNGKKDGIQSWWYKSGRKMKRVGYKNGHPEGVEMIWYESGQKQYEMHWKNGQKNGVSREWGLIYGELAQYGIGDQSPTHRMEYETHYKNGKENGLRKEWSRDGRLTYKANFVNGAEEIK